MPDGLAARGAAVPHGGAPRRAARLLTGIDVDATDNLFAAIRVLFHRFSLINVAVLAVLTLTSGAPAPWKVVALTAAGLLVWHWCRGFAAGGFALWAPLSEGVALAAIAAAIGDPLRALSLYYVALYFRTLYGRPRHAVILGVAYLASHVGSVALAGPLGTAGEARLLGSTVLMQIPGFVTTVVAMHTLLMAGLRNEEDRRRQTLLAAAGAALGAAEQRAAVAAATLQPARDLVGGRDGAGAAVVALAEHGTLRITAASAAPLRGQPLDLRRAAADLPQTLERGTIVTLDAQQARAIDLPWPGATAVPMVSDQDLRGVLLVSGVQSTLHDALVALAAQAALALARVDAAAEVHAREARFRSLLANASDVIGVLDHRGRVLYESEGLTRMLGLLPADVIGREAIEFVHPDDADEVRAVFAEVVADVATAVTIECRLRHADGAWRDVEAVVRNLLGDPAVAGIVVNYRDVTERTELERRLRHQALHDALTDLPNRDLFYDRVNHALDQRRRAGGLVGIVYIDLDNFKLINDALGHGAGDEVLIAVARRLRDALRDADTCARLGGDEFAVLLEDLDRPEDAYEAGARLLDALGAPVRCAGQSVTIEASAGVVVTSGTETVDELVRDADIAMYRAKGSGKGRYAVFEASMRDAVRERVRLRTDLERGLAAGEFVVHYQVIVALSSLAVVGVEALVRWRHPERGLLSPEAFMPLAEETGLVVPIGRSVLTQACRDAAGWRNRQGGPLRLSVNLSAAELSEPDLDAFLGRTVAETGFDVQRLAVELTENMLLHDAAATREALHAITARGVEVVLDDFGTGYSSLAYLERYPVDVVKIDSSFVAPLGQPGESPMAGAIIALGHTFDVHISAEGVERRAQVERLRALGCELAQGSYFAAPCPAEDIPRLLAGEARLLPATAGGGEA